MTPTPMSPDAPADDPIHGCECVSACVGLRTIQYNGSQDLEGRFSPPVAIKEVQWPAAYRRTTGTKYYKPRAGLAAVQHEIGMMLKSGCISVRREGGRSHLCMSEGRIDE